MLGTLRTVFHVVLTHALGVRDCCSFSGLGSNVTSSEKPSLTPCINGCPSSSFLLSSSSHPVGFHYCSGHMLSSSVAWLSAPLLDLCLLGLPLYHRLPAQHLPHSRQPVNICGINSHFADGETETQRGEQLSQGRPARRGRSRTQILVLLTPGPQFPFTVLYRNSLTWGLCPGFLGCHWRCGQVKVLPLTWLYKSQLPGHIWPLTAGVLGVTMGFKRPLRQVQTNKGLSGLIPPTLLIWEDTTHPNCLSLSGPERTLESKACLLASEYLSNIQHLTHEGGCPWCPGAVVGWGGRVLL